MTRIAAPIAIALSLSCSDDATSPDGMTDGGTMTVSSTTGRVDMSDAITCADAGQRDAGHFEFLSPASQRPLGEGNWYLTSAGVVVADFDGDGRLDIFLPHEAPFSSQLWMSDGDPSQPPSDEAPLRFDGIDLSGAVGGTAVDVDGDLDLDLFVTRWQQPNLLLRNDGKGFFADVTAVAGLDKYAWRSQSSSWADMDADGDLDLFVGSYGAQPEEMFDDPELKPSEDDSELWRNNGDGTFTDESHLLDASVHDGFTFMSSWFDINEDGYPELFIWNDFGTAHPSRALLNEEGAGFAFQPGSGQSGIDRAFEDMGVGVADLNGDRMPDFAVTSFVKINLLTSLASTSSFVDMTWIDGTAARGLALDTSMNSDLGRNQNYGWGAQFGDLDHDRDQDLVALFGYWSSYTGTADPRWQQDGLWLQSDEGNFENLAFEPEWNMADPVIGRGVMLADINDDGYLDVLKRPLDAPLIQHTSRCGDRAWLRVDVRQTDLNPYGVGTRITAISPDAHEQTRWILAGSDSMYSGGPPEVHFGLADDETVDLEVLWPDMTTSVFEDIPVRRKVTLYK